MNDSLVLLGRDVRLELLPWGATMRRFEVARGDRWRNIVLGHPSLDDYQTNVGYLGSSVGRFANRLGRATFTLNDVRYDVDVNEPPNQVHGGRGGFSHRLWTVADSGVDWAELTVTSEDGDQGFPGTVQVRARFEVFDCGASVTYTATTDAPTVINLTTHPYFNLDGEGEGTIEQHRLQVNASAFTPTHADGIPTGEVRSVAGSAMDLRAGAVLGTALDGVVAEGIDRNGGLDHNFVVDGEGLREHCRLTGSSDLTLRVWSDQPALMVYSGEHVGGVVGTSGHSYAARAGVALEAQGFPDAPNHPNFPSTVLLPDQEFSTTTRWLVC